MQAETQAAESKKELPRRRRLYFPDGSYLPALNGATNVPSVAFRDRAYSPVIGKAKDDTGREWYQHEDGSSSTTFMGWRKDLGRYDGNTVVAHPTDSRPRLVEEEGGGTRELVPPVRKQ